LKELVYTPEHEPSSIAGSRLPPPTRVSNCRVALRQAPPDSEHRRVVFDPAHKPLAFGG